MKVLATYIVAFEIIQFIVCNYLFDTMHIDKIWFISNALSHFLLAIALRLVIDSSVITCLDFFTLNMLWKEIFGNPIWPTTSEYYAALIFVSIILIENIIKHYVGMDYGNRNKI